MPPSKTKNGKPSVLLSKSAHKNINFAKQIATLLAIWDADRSRMGDPLLGKIYARMGPAPKPPNGTGSKLFMRTSDRYQIVSESHRIGIGSDRCRIESGSDRIGIGSGSERIWIGSGSDREGPGWPDVEKFTAMLD